MLNICDDALERLLNENSVLNFLFRRVSTLIETDPITSNIIASFILTYIKVVRISLDEAMEKYDLFIRQYNHDCERFLANGKMPVEDFGFIRKIDRQTYDISLLLSCLTSAHRYRIMQEIRKTSSADNRKIGSASFVGCGPGLEIALAGNSYTNCEAYDVSLSPILENIFQDIRFFAELFPRENSRKYDAIYIIELLEHLENPYALLDKMGEVLSPKGKIFCTTATDIPQFDHLYNFPSDHSEFEKRVSTLGLSIEKCEIFVHDYVFKTNKAELKSKNHFYILSAAPV